jgi:bidirectional [NiFe] hydrogenase diaphorase subunit
MSSDGVAARTAGVPVTPPGSAAGTGLPATAGRRGQLVPGELRATAKVCQAAGCLSGGSEAVYEALRERVALAGPADVAVRRVGCLGLCAAGPLVAVPERGRVVDRVSAGDEASLGQVLTLLQGGTAGRSTVSEPFFARQVKVVTERCGVVDPENVEDYLAHGGYAALAKAVKTMTPSEVLAEVTASGLRGRGGAGYPTGLKWATVVKAGTTGERYVVCNADEGDPGAFLDRAVLESCPQQVLEGMAIAAYAVGSSRGYVYIRAEYPLTVSRLSEAVREAERAGLLGSRIADTSFQFHVEVRIGAGAYVCGEETALIASIEGGRGTPRPRPPYPATAGLWGRPTLINNVETLAAVPPIIARGGAWYAAMGTAKSRGTKVFGLAGAVVNTGLIEVPMGTTLRDIVFGIGGGIRGGRRFKAVQTGGPAGGCVPEDLLDMPVDYEALTAAGSMMGSGGMIVMDETTCMVDLAKFFMDFCRQESCGKCVPCRAGTTQLHHLLDRITRGLARRDDLRRLRRLAGAVQSMSLCGLGQGAPNPIFATLRYFEDEYRSHVEDRVCPAGVCSMEPDEAPCASGVAR